MRKTRFLVDHRDGPQWREGYLFDVAGHILVAHKEEGAWQCSDYSSGWGVNIALGRFRHPTRRSLVASAQEVFSKPGMKARLRALSVSKPSLNGAEMQAPPQEGEG